MVGRIDEPVCDNNTVAACRNGSFHKWGTLTYICILILHSSLGSQTSSFSEDTILSIITVIVSISRRSFTPSLIGPTPHRTPQTLNPFAPAERHLPVQRIKEALQQKKKAPNQSNKRKGEKAKVAASLGSHWSQSGTQNGNFARLYCQYWPY